MEFLGKIKALQSQSSKEAIGITLAFVIIKVQKNLDDILQSNSIIRSREKQIKSDEKEGEAFLVGYIAR